MGGYLDMDCKNCGRRRVESDGVCEKCHYDNINNEYKTEDVEYSGCELLDFQNNK
jgi:uncharacterized OB-fold protein